MKAICPAWVPFMLLATVIITAETEHSDFVRIWPEKAVVEFGSSIVLNCTSNCPGITLESDVSGVLVGNGTTWKATNLTNVNQWVLTPSCIASCGKSSRANFTVYRVPEHVILNPLPKMQVGKKYNLTCQIPSVAPIRKLTVTLFKGGKTLLVKNFENDGDPEAREIVVTHAITAQKEDDAERVACQARLDLRPEGQLFEKTSYSKLLGAAGGDKGLFEVTLSPRMVAVKRGGSVWLNCSFTCNSTNVALETSLQQGKVEQGPGWVSTQLLNITKQTYLVQCYQDCEGESKNAIATILTYDPPEHVFMELVKSSSSQNIQQTYNLTCHVIKITPVHNLSVILMKGAKRVHSWKLQNHTKSGTESFNVTHAIALRPHEHGQEASCHVTLDLNAEEHVPIATSSKLELKTPETYRGVIAAISAIGMLATVLLGISMYLVLARGSLQL